MKSEMMTIKTVWPSLRWAAHHAAQMGQDRFLYRPTSTVYLAVMKADGWDAVPSVDAASAAPCTVRPSAGHEVPTPNVAVREPEDGKRHSL